MRTDKNYYFRTASGEWSSRIVVTNTDPVDLRTFEEIKEGGESKQ